MTLKVDRQLTTLEREKFRLNQNGDTCVSICRSTAPIITNLSAPSANTEVSHTFQDNTQKFHIKTRSSVADMQFAFTSGQSDTVFITIPSGVTFTEDDLDLSGVTIFLQTDKGNQTIEILEWAN